MAIKNVQISVRYVYHLLCYAKLPLFSNFFYYIICLFISLSSSELEKNQENCAWCPKLYAQALHLKTQRKNKNFDVGV